LGIERGAIRNLCHGCKVSAYGAIRRPSRSVKRQSWSNPVAARSARSRAQSNPRAATSTKCRRRSNPESGRSSQVLSTERSVINTDARCGKWSNLRAAQGVKCQVPSQIGGCRRAMEAECGAIRGRRKEPSVECRVICTWCNRNARGRQLADQLHSWGWLGKPEGPSAEH